MKHQLPQPIFELQLKLGNQILPVQVLDTDDRHSLVNRVCLAQKIDVHYRELIQAKIMDALLKILKT